MSHVIAQGELVRKLGDLDLAAFCVKHAAELDEGLGQSPTQKAIVQSFLKNYDRAIETLAQATRIKPVAPLFILLGKTQMKAMLWTDAVQSFQQALEIVVRSAKIALHPQPLLDMSREGGTKIDEPTTVLVFFFGNSVHKCFFDRVFALVWQMNF